MAIKTTTKKCATSCCGPKAKKITFQLSAANATSVLLTGDFNAWSQAGLKMKKEKNGVWKTDLELSAGRYEYKFVVDGKWWTDPANKHTAVNSFGDTNSVIEVAA
ncbi:MAG: glycogen-binding domain-containing protein [Candidatus Omnitrophota bacterium]|jgi:1,4-alpha-glucan branching enzyme